MSKLRGAIIGCGFVSEFHLLGWSRLPEVEICALVDPDRARAEARQARFAPQARIYESIEDLIRHEAVDFVDIITAPWLHREQCLAAARAGLHIICQKPLCDRLDDAEALVDALQRYPKRFCVHENHRYRPWFREILRLSQLGNFGRLRYLELTQHDPSEPPEKIDTTVEHGVFLQYGVHLVDMVHALLGKPLTISARMLHLNPRVRGESLAHALFAYPSAMATVNVSWKAVGVQQSHALLVGDEGEAWYEGPLARGNAARFRIFRNNTVVSDEIRWPANDYIDSFYQFEKDFVDSVLSHTPPPQPATANLESLRTTFAAYAAAAEAPLPT
jgi:D-apiose dehydrogenase